MLTSASGGMSDETAALIAGTPVRERGGWLSRVVVMRWSRERLSHAFGNGLRSPKSHTRVVTQMISFQWLSWVPLARFSVSAQEWYSDSPSGPPMGTRGKQKGCLFQALTPYPPFPPCAPPLSEGERPPRLKCPPCLRWPLGVSKRASPPGRPGAPGRENRPPPRGAGPEPHVGSHCCWSPAGLPLPRQARAEPPSFARPARRGGDGGDRSSSFVQDPGEARV